MKIAKGEFVAFYHSDDMYESDIVEKEVEFLQNHADVAAVFTLDRLINENDKVIAKTNILKELREIEELFIGITTCMGTNMRSTRSLGNTLYRIQCKLTRNL